MKLALREYQSELLRRLRAELRLHRRVVCQLPTGGGKTVIASEMMDGVAARARVGYFIVHRQELVDQTSDTFEEAGIPHGIISAGYPVNPYQPIQVCSVDTLRNRLASGTFVRAPDLVGWDECHHIAAAGWRLVMSYFPKALHVGMTATPERLDGRGLDDQFSGMVCGPSTRELIEAGHLADYRLFAPAPPDLAGVAVKMGDYAKGQVEAVMDRPTITGDAIAHYRAHADGKRALAFCVSIKHSERVAAQFREAGIAAVHVDGATDRRERRAIMQAFRRGEVKVMTNVDLFGEGLDVPAAEVLIGLRPTKSLALYLQQVGRVLRKDDGKACATLLDHAGNVKRHGLPDDERDWKLAGSRQEGKPRKKQAERAPALELCDRCHALYAKARFCPHCGAPAPAAGREVEHVEGNLRNLDVAAIRAARLAEQRRCGSEQDLIALGRRRGYRNPESWAKHYWHAKLARVREAWDGANEPL